jgi:DNA-binding GntR family transcriptional regulator
LELLSADPRDRRPLGLRIYERLRDGIVSGELTANSQLVQEQVAEQLGASRTPVRDALNRLALEGLVNWLPGSGYLVNALTEADVQEVRQVRESLETLGLRLAAGRHDAARIARLSAVIEDMAGADPTDAARQFELNRQFHLGLIEPCGNAVLLRMLESLWEHPINRRITGSYIKKAGHVSIMIAEHRAMLEAASDGATDHLVELALAHLQAGYGEALEAS